MDVNAEAKRIMALSLGKLYSSRSQRGGLRLHRSLLLTIVMRTARDIYHTPRLFNESEGQPTTVQCVQEPLATEEPMDTSNAQVETSAPECAPLPSTPESSSSEGESEPVHPSCTRGEEDKENHSPGTDRRSRKRRGKATAEPDFLPSKKARIETGGESSTVRGTGLRCSNGNRCRVGDSLTSVPLSLAIAAF
ncbi:immediate early response 2b [Megalops cyprinoides]|uniref:immediate early response 2b n=1 Tax=Megalops cyprinoides TaxID=118141 RepID=UPI001863D020|nr:immediate early response 2b [Megalops cyprinoides]